jgi:hypothetical protein
MVVSACQALSKDSTPFSSSWLLGPTNKELKVLVVGLS